MATLERVTLRSSDGWTLPGEFRHPSPGAANRGSVLLLHQLRVDRHSMDALADALCQAGFVTLAVDARGHGESRVEGRAKSWELFNEAAGDFKGLTDDAQTALDALAKAAPDNRVFVVGSSVGATNAVLLAAKPENHVAGVALLSVGLNYRGVDCRTQAGAVRCPVFIAASQDDSYADHCSHKLQAAWKANGVDVTAAWLSGAGHGTDMLRYEGLFGRVVDWLAARCATTA